MKIIDKINKSIAEGKTFFSFEFFPPKTQDGVDNLFERMDGMVAHGPTFCDITWGAGGSTADLTLDIADRMQNEINIECMMHLTCTNMPEAKLKEALGCLQKFGVTNILALRGDPPHGMDKFEVVDGGFSCALDLIKYIRRETGTQFGIGVSGYPEAHPDAIVEDKEQMEKNYWADIHYLKEKLDAGADFVVTQLFYDVDIFIKWVKDCRSVGITAPIIPGIMPIMAHGGFNRMTAFCKTYVPEAVRAKVESLKDDAEGLKEYGVQLAVDMCSKILEAKLSPGLHMYSLNQDKSVLAILERLKLLVAATPPRALPFRARTRAPSEAVRPVHWANRPKSYVARTLHWTRFPQARWAEVNSEAYIPAPARFMNYLSGNEKRRLKALAAWGSPATVEDVKAVFTKFVSREIAMFPWAEAPFPADSHALGPQLCKLIQAGYLPINACAAVDGQPSGVAPFGWGPPGGFVYQRGYLEFFCSPADFTALSGRLSTLPTLSYMAVTKFGEFQASSTATTALSWGAFPDSEVVQPVVACETGFRAWKDEAFELWTSEWGSVAGEGSPSAALLQEIRDTWYLVSLIENDYKTGDIFRVLA